MRLGNILRYARALTNRNVALEFQSGLYCELPKSPVSVPIHATPSPTPTQVDEERQEPTTETPNGDASALTGRAPDAETDSVEQGQGDVAERAPPTPAKDTAVSSRTTVPEAASGDTSAAAST